MTSKRKPTRAIQKARSFRLRDLQTEDGIRLDLWAVDAPSKTYDANCCDVLVETRELVLAFGQNPPGSSKPLTAISIGLPLSELPLQLAGFDDIKRQRLEKQNFTEAEEAACRLDRQHLATLTTHTYARFSAEYMRAASSDSYVTLDFYRRPTITLRMIEARPNDVFELVPSVRVICPSVVLSLMLRLVDAALKEVEP